MDAVLSTSTRPGDGGEADGLERAPHRLGVTDPGPDLLHAEALRLTFGRDDGGVVRGP
jgi:hypothetical protein